MQTQNDSPTDHRRPYEALSLSEIQARFSDDPLLAPLVEQTITCVKAFGKELGFRDLSPFSLTVMHQVSSISHKLARDWTLSTIKHYYKVAETQAPDEETLARAYAEWKTALSKEVCCRIAVSRTGKVLHELRGRCA